MKNVKILVTGASGFVGSALVSFLLKAGVGKIICPLRNNDSIEKLKTSLKLDGLDIDNNHLEVFECLLTDYEELRERMRECDSVVHTAAKVKICNNSKDSIIAENTYITECVVAAAVDSGIKHFIHLSSIATLESKGQKLITEFSFPEVINSKSPYAISKFHSENSAWAATINGLRVSVLLPAVIIGDGKGIHKSSALLSKIFSIKQPFYFEGVTGFVMLEDVLKAIIAIYNNPDTKSERYLLCSENLSYKELQLRLSGKRPTIKIANWILKVTKFKLKIAEKLGLNLQITSAMIESLLSKHYYDGSLITKKLDFKYTSVKH